MPAGCVNFTVRSCTAHQVSAPWRENLALPEEAAMSAMTETPARPTIEPTDRQAIDLRDDPTQTGGSPVRMDRPSADGAPPPAGPGAPDPLDASPSDAELWFG
jgi:hypothetical protein